MIKPPTSQAKRHNSPDKKSGAPQTSGRSVDVRVQGNLPINTPPRHPAHVFANSINNSINNRVAHPPQIIHRGQRPVDCALVQKLVNLLMISGKKSKAYRTFSQASAEFSLLKRESGRKETPTVKQSLGENTLQESGRNAPFLLQLNAAIDNVQPSLECKKCRIAGTSYQVPAIVTPKRGRYLALRWIVEAARRRTRNSKLPFSRSLAVELLDAAHKRGGPRERRNQCHKLAEANRGYLRYRWW